MCEKIVFVIAFRGHFMGFKRKNVLPEHELWPPYERATVFEETGLLSACSVCL